MTVGKLELDIRKALAFGDIHFGFGRNSKLKLDTAVRTVDWIDAVSTERGVDTVIFLGDWFDNRNILEVPTINAAYDCAKKLASKRRLVMIVGNHDINLKTENHINSVRMYADIPNVTVIQDPTLISAPGAVVAACPFNTDVKAMPGGNALAVGHFEFNGASLCGSVDKDRSFNISDLGRLAPVVLTGHYHINKRYPLDGSCVYSVGDPFQLDWGDYGNDKGVYIIDVAGGSEPEFVRNSDAPVHKIVKWSNRSGEMPPMEGDIVKLVVDEGYKYDEVVSFVNRLNERNPAKMCEVEYAYSVDAELLDVKTVHDDHSQISKKDYIRKYVERIDGKALSDEEKSEAVAMLDRYYAAAEEAVGE